MYTLLSASLILDCYDFLSALFVMHVLLVSYSVRHLIIITKFIFYVQTFQMFPFSIYVQII